MKVLHINKTDAGGGAAVAALRIHRALLRSGVDSHILVQFQKRSEVNEHVIGRGMLHNLRSNWNFVKERLTILPSEREASIRFNFSVANTGFDVAQLPIVQEADVINLHWINQGFISLDGLKDLFALGKPIVWTLHDMWPFTGGCHYAGNCLEFNERCGFCCFLRDRGKNDFSTQVFMKKREIYSQGNLSVVTCSRWLNTLAHSSSLFRHVPVTTIPNSIDTNFYRPLDRMQCREELGLPKDKRLILFGAANINDARKGFRYLEEALTIIQENFPQVASHIELLIFGNAKGPEPDLGFETHLFKFISDPSKIVKLYNAADAFILPSLQDNLPNTVMESLCCGTPVVGFRIGGIPEMVTHKETGYLAEVKNSLSLANGIYNMLFFDDEKRQMIRERAVTQFGEEIVARQYIDVYNKALKR